MFGVRVASRDASVVIVGANQKLCQQGSLAVATMHERMQASLAEVEAVDTQIDELLANDSLTDEQEKQYESLQGRRASLVESIQRAKDQIAREDERRRLMAEAQALSRRVAVPGTARLTTADARTPHQPPATPGMEVPDYAHVASGLTGRPKRIIPDGVRRVGALRHFRGESNGYSAEERAYRFGMWAMAQLSLQLPGRYRFREALEWYDKEMAASSSRDGYGTHYLIPEEFGTDIISLREQYGVVRKLFKIVPMASDTRTDPRRLSGVSAYWVAEGAAITASNKTWDNVRLTARDLAALSRISNQVVADSAINWGDDIAGEIALAFATTEDDCGLNGTGASTYGGIVGARSALANVSGGAAGLVTQASGNTWSDITLSDLENVVAKLPQYADADPACWVCHRAFYYGVMLRLELAAGGSAAAEIASGDRRPRPMFLGYPVEFAQIMPSATATSTIPVLLGNFMMGASLGDRQQTSIAFSEDATIEGENLFERNQIAIRGVERIDIVVHSVGDSSTPGPIVGLKTGS